MSYIGTSKVGGVYLGDTKIAKAYLGEDLVFDRSGTTPPQPQEAYWLVSNGSSYCDIDVKPTSTMSYHYLFYVASLRSYGPHILSTSNVFCPLVRPLSGGQFFWKYTSEGSKTMTISTNTAYEVSALRDGSSIVVNGSTIGSASGKSDNVSLYAFAYRGAPTNSQFSPLNGGIGYIEIYDNGVLVHNFVPKEVNGVAGLYDTIGETFHPSATSTPFTITQRN